MDEYSEDKTKDVEVAIETLAGLGSLAALITSFIGISVYSTKSKKQKPLLQLFGPFGVSAFTAIPLILWGNRKQKQASRIARYQARE